MDRIIYTSMTGANAAAQRRNSEQAHAAREGLLTPSHEDHPGASLSGALSSH